MPSPGRPSSPAARSAGASLPPSTGLSEREAFAKVVGRATTGGRSEPDGSFESGLGEWEPAAHVGPEVPLAEFERAVDVTDERAYAGERSLRVFTEGDHDDGTAWATHPVRVEPGRSYEATVSLRAWSETESFNTLRHLVARLGRERPGAEADFPDPGVNTSTIEGAPYGGLREPLHLQAGWREYEFSWTTPRLSSDELFVSVGVSVVWEADATHFVDEVRVEL